VPAIALRVNIVSRASAIDLRIVLPPGRSCT
jgi:hypothetical protein